MMRDASAWAPLLPVAMVGTDRHAAPLPQWPGPVGATISALAEAAPSAAEASGIARATADVLRAAGILTVCGLAGARAHASAPEAGDAAASGSLPAVTDGALPQALDWTLREAPDRLKQDFLQRLAQHGLRLPHALLPLALELARQSSPCGRWSNLCWTSAASGSPANAPTGGSRPASSRPPSTIRVDADEGTLEQRVNFLAAERARDARAARERLAGALPELPAKERAELARGLAAGLCPEDEPLLEQLRGDRGQDVRAVALDLLLRLPDAAYTRRACARAEALMSRGGLLSGRKWAIEPPTEAAAAWKSDPIDADAPPGGLRQRAWWLYQLVRQVPLDWWTSHTGLTPPQLLAWARQTDWGDALWRGWREVLRHAPQADWAELMLQDDVKSPPGDREFALGIVTPAVRERWIVRQLASSEASLHATLWTIIAGCKPGETIAATLCAAVVQRVRRALAHNTALDPGPSNVNVFDQDGAGRALPELCCTLPLSFLADYEDWPVSSSESPAVARARHAGRQILQARRRTRGKRRPVHHAAGAQ